MKSPRRLSRDELWEYALKALGGRAHSSADLKRKLAHRAARAEDVDPVIARLKESGYLNDHAYAEAYAHARREDGVFGRGRVLQDLRQKRIPPATAESAVRKAFDGVDEDRLAGEFLRRKYRAGPREGLFATERDMAAAWRRLRRAGFSSGVALRALKRVAADPALLDAFEPPEEPEEEPGE